MMDLSGPRSRASSLSALWVAQNLCLTNSGTGITADSGEVLRGCDCGPLVVDRA